jgi:hypothetical protein
MAHPMYPRSEFPTETPPPICDAKGRIRLAALRYRFSAMGCPHASPEVAAALIKSGCDSGIALSLAMLAYYAQECMTEPLARTSDALAHMVEREHATRHPHGKCAEDLAARREGRESRWGGREFHGAAFHRTCTCALYRNPEHGPDYACQIHSPRGGR